jgi:hypothetical protein
MKIMTTALRTTAMLGAAAVLLAPSAHADVDTDFANQLHTYGVYGPRDYNAWIGKISCKRLATHLDETAVETATFVKRNLDQATTTEQTWQFLGAAIAAYCPDQTPALLSAAQ